MSKITIDRAVVEQALEALSYYEHRNIEWDYADEQAITALRAALEQPQVEQEPVAYNGWVLRDVLFDNGEPVGHRAPQPAQQACKTCESLARAVMMDQKGLA